MKKILAWLVIFSIVISLSICPVSALEYGEEWAGAESESAVIYSDVTEDHWAFENIKRVSDKKWFGGYPDGTFRPQNSITRAESLKVFDVFLGLEVVPVSTSTYYDVDVNEWYSPYIEAGKELLPERTSIQGKIPFQPNMPITREDAMYALVKALGYDSKTKVADQSVLDMFSDKNSISSNVKAYVAVAVTEGLVSGHADGTIGAQDPLTRAEFATLLYRASFIGFNVTADAKLQSVSVEPSVKKELKVGESFTVKGIATYSDGTTKDYETLNPYNSDDNGVVSINKNKITALKAGVCEIHFNDDNVKDKSIVVIVAENEEEKKEDDKKEEEKPPVTPDDKEDEKEEEKPVVPDDKEEDKDEPVVPDDKEDEKDEPVTPDDNEDENEETQNGENWCKENAIEIDLNGSVKGSMEFSVEEDNVKKMNERWYKIVMPAPGTIELSYLSETMQAQINVGEINFGRWTAKTARTYKQNIMDGTYYIRVAREGITYGEFALHIKTTLADISDGWSREKDFIGWTKDTAIAAEFGKVYTSSKLTFANYYEPTGKKYGAKFKSYFYTLKAQHDGIVTLEGSFDYNQVEKFIILADTEYVIATKGGSFKADFEKVDGLSENSAVEMKLNSIHKGQFVAVPQRGDGYYAKFTIPISGYVTLVFNNMNVNNRVTYKVYKAGGDGRVEEKEVRLRSPEYYFLDAGDHYIYIDNSRGNGLEWPNRTKPTFDIKLDFSTESPNTSTITHNIINVK